jgi:hypothetical protein
MGWLHGERMTKMRGGGILYDGKTGISGLFLESMGGGGGGDDSLGGEAVNHATMTVQERGVPDVSCGKQVL